MRHPAAISFLLPHLLSRPFRSEGGSKGGCPTRPFIDAANVGRMASFPGQRRLAAGRTATRLRLKTCRRLPPFGLVEEMLTIDYTASSPVLDGISLICPPAGGAKRSLAGDGRLARCITCQYGALFGL